MTHSKTFKRPKILFFFLSLLLSSLLFSQVPNNPDAFMATWRITENEKSITIPTYPGEIYDYNIDWGDGTINMHVAGDITHSYTETGDFTVSITGVFPRIYFNSYNSSLEEIPPYTIGVQQLISIDQWGTNAWSSMNSAFNGCLNLQILASDAPNLNQVNDASFMFAFCINLNNNLNHWDVSNITHMEFMFFYCFNFNQLLNNWDVSHVSNMSYLFSACENFNQPLNNWDVSQVTDMSYLFSGCENFDQPLNNWDVSNVTDMASLFERCTNFNQTLNLWNVKNVQDMSYMFYKTTLFNQDISNWNVKNVQEMNAMFFSSTSFNQDISNWNVKNVLNMSYMFSEATSFNQNISKWNVENVQFMDYMFLEASNFNQALGQWNIKNVLNMTDMLYDSGLSTANYDSTLIGWSSKVLQNKVNFQTNTTYCLSQEARQYIIDTYDWNISDGGPAIGFGEDQDNDGLTDCADDCPGDATNTCNAIMCDDDKYQICHRKQNGTYQTLCVSLEDYQMHKAHGDSDGACESASASKIASKTKTTVVSFHEGLTLYPNPANNNITISGLTNTPHTIEIRDITGKLLISNHLNDSNASYTINLTSLPQGLYLFTLKNTKETVVKKIIKE
ncbi:BspA family leucine-rich repeat surface protein [Aestuariibaculum lutulentum]|uniref:BspA family leucine-rich repeat surface protein n=1 Tax=Aestuariibaculum lutulentum TaxID=2920935 RepID=A0ABS9RHN0_9FLAO|nr:BspA family leucine-rich repeat surface protein [Aestuariibaculum lutulentum]MCH4552434.1 BspA family leucine-rich repeat surface protein [Aestuariibaculum lutulentum]